MLDISREDLLARVLRTDEDKVKEALALMCDYRIVRIPKKQRGHRTICIPAAPLMKIQKAINRHLFRKVWDTSHNGLFAGVFGIYRKTSHVEHAKLHKDAQWVFQFDLKDAFQSVDVSMLRKALYHGIHRAMIKLEDSIYMYREMLKHYAWTDEEVDKAMEAEDEYDTSDPLGESRYLRKLKKEVVYSTFYSLKNFLALEKVGEPRFSWQKLLFPQKEEMAQQLADLVMELTTFQGILPQGTPTAPFLFYLFLAEREVLVKIGAVCPSFYPRSQDRYGFRVSAYIDNFCVSSQKPIPEKNQQELYKAVEECGLKVNRQKTRHQGMQYGSPLITGLRITRGMDGERKIVLPKRTIRRWRGLIHRAIYEPALRPKVHGLVASLLPIYGYRLVVESDYEYIIAHKKFPRRPLLPPQLEKPYQKLQAVMQQNA